MTIMGDNAAEDAEITEALVDVEIMAILITDMTIKNMDLDAVKDNVILAIAEGVVTLVHIEDTEDSGMEMTQITVTETNRDRNCESQGNSNRGRRWDNNSRGQGHSDRGRGRRWNPNQQYHDQGINRSPLFQIQITTDHPRWDINIDTQPHMVSTHTPSNNNNTRHKCQRLLNEPLIFVNCVTVKAIMITNANLQATLWHAHKKPLIKVDHTVTKTLIMGNGHKAKLITMTQMGNLFSSGGSRCR